MARLIKWLPLPAGVAGAVAFGTIRGEPPAREAAAQVKQTAAGKSLHPVHPITAAEAEEVLRMRDEARPEEREAMTVRWQQFLERWATGHPRDAAEFLEARGQLKPNGPETIVLLRGWARGDAVAIFDWINAGGDVRNLWWNSARPTFAGLWLEQNREAAWAWVNEGGNEGMESLIVNTVFQAAAPEDIAGWLARHSADDAKISPAARSTALGMLSQLHIKNDGADGALAWAEALPRPEDQSYAVQVMLPALTATAPEKSLAWLVKRPSHGPRENWQAKEAMMKWSTRDSATAGEWLNAHRTSPVAPALIEGYAMSIAGDDPAAARQWIAKLPDSPAPQAYAGGWPARQVYSGGGPMMYSPPGRAALEHLVSLAEITTIALDHPARAVGLIAALPPGQSLSDYQLSLVREAPGEKPVPVFTPVSPYG